MTLHTEVFATRRLIERRWYSTPGTVTDTAPAGSSYMRISMVGAGGWVDNGYAASVYGGGAAFARKKTTCSPGESFSIKVGDRAHTLGAGDAAGDSSVTRVSGSVLLCKAERGKGLNASNKGLAANSVGDVTRDGTDGTLTYPGNTAGGPGSDIADAIGLGFGGRGQYFGNRPAGANRGGGGCLKATQFQYGVAQLPPGNGLVCIEFFNQDPGY